MTNSEIQPGLPGGGSPIESTRESAAARGAERSARADAPAFRALLERLQEQTAKIESESRTLDDPEALAGAVDIARASLDDAMSLSDQLLEAFRETQVQSPAGEDETDR